MVRVLRKCFYYFLIVVLCLSGPGILLAWKFYVEPNWGTIEVIQAIHSIDRGKKVTENDVKINKIRKETIVSGAVIRLQDVLNKEATRLIRGNEQITLEMINGKHLVPNDGEWNLSLPAEWVFGKPPGSLLRGDEVSLLLVKKEEVTKLEEIESKPDFAKSVLSRQVLTKQEYSRLAMEELGVSLEEENKLTGITVSYAKGSNNQEIASVDERKKPTGSVNNIELIVTDEQKTLIRKYGVKGFKFLIVYK